MKYIKLTSTLVELESSLISVNPNRITHYRPISNYEKIYFPKAQSLVELTSGTILHVRECCRFIKLLIEKV